MLPYLDGHSRRAWSQVLGRGPGVDVQVAADGISAQHCSVEVVKGGVKVTDLKSTNGTLINGRDVSASQRQVPCIAAACGRAMEKGKGSAMPAYALGRNSGEL